LTIGESNDILWPVAPEQFINLQEGGEMSVYAIGVWSVLVGLIIFIPVLLYNLNPKVFWKVVSLLLWVVDHYPDCSLIYPNKGVWTKR